MRLVAMSARRLALLGAAAGVSAAALTGCAERAQPGAEVVLFASDADGDWEVCVANPDGTGFRQITDNEVADFSPAASPDGSKIAFISTRDGRSDLFLTRGVYEIYLMEPDGTGQKRLTTDEAVNESPGFDNTGGVIVYSSDRDSEARGANFEVYTFTLRDSRIRRLTNHPAWDRKPRFSPDGRRIAFVSNRDGNPEVYLMDSDGGNVRRLTDHPAWDDDPAFSSDGKRLLFASNRQDGWELYSMDLDGGSLRRLTRNDSKETGPAHSSDGSRIAFVSLREQAIDVYVAGADGTAEVRVTQGGAAREPSFMRLGATDR